MADNITYTDKEQGQVNPAPTVQKYTFEDANEVKTVVNNNATELTATTAKADANETNIATNVTNIATNTSDIATNVTNIATNASGIATNVTDIATNTSDIATNVTDISTNTSNIATNVTDISTNATNIATNVTNIATNVTDIATAQSTADAALPKAGGTLTGALLGDQSARLYRPQSENALATDTNLDALTPNSRILIGSVANTVTITVTDLANTNFPIGTVFEFIWRVGINDINFVASGSQSILSADDNLKMRTRYCAVSLSKEFNNVWYLIGDLKA